MTNTQPSHILDYLVTAVVVLDGALNITYVNTAAETLLGVSGEKSAGKPLQNFFANDNSAPTGLQEALKGGEGYTRRRANWKLKPDRDLVVDFSVSPDTELNQLIIEIHVLDRVLRISRDEAWLASQETTNNMVRSMAHEIKNPLGGIRGAAQLLSRELEDNDLEEFTKIIIDETDRLRNLTDRMLGPNKPIHHRPVNVHDVLEHVKSVTSLEAPTGVCITRDYDPSIPDLMGDREQLIQALLNIVRNAMQALSENNIEDGLVTLRTRVKRRHTIGRKTHRLIAEISIIDNGPGIPPELIEDIFFPMITGRAEGTGLGLAISQNLITRHEGLIECSSVPGNTVFSIYLPLGMTNA